MVFPALGLQAAERFEAFLDTHCIGCHGPDLPFIVGHGIAGIVAEVRGH